jgi:hypothetical protein
VEVISFSHPVVPECRVRVPDIFYFTVCFLHGGIVSPDGEVIQGNKTAVVLRMVATMDSRFRENDGLRI